MDEGSVYRKTLTVIWLYETKDRKAYKYMPYARIKSAVSVCYRR